MCVCKELLVPHFELQNLFPFYCIAWQFVNVHECVCVNTCELANNTLDSNGCNELKCKWQLALLFVLVTFF